MIISQVAHPVRSNAPRDAALRNVVLYAGADPALGERRARSIEARADGSLRITVAADLDAAISDRCDVLVLAEALPLGPEREARLIEFVQRGGGLVCLGNSADNWLEYPRLAAAFGMTPGRRTPLTELIVRIPAASDHPITRRLEAGYAHDHYAGLDADIAFPLVDTCLLSGPTGTASDEALLLVSWRGERLPAAWVRPVGRGWLFHTGLGAEAGTWSVPVFQQLVYRAIRHCAGCVEGPPLGVAMLGYGAIGREHCSAVSQVRGLELRAVCDRSPARLEVARQNFSAVATTTELAAIACDPAIDLVIVSTPPNTHARFAMELLEAGKHVVVEKPFCLTTSEADAMTARADAVGRVLTVYQCRRWDPDYLAIKRVVDSGAIGEVFHLETFIGSFSHPCDYWHSQQAISGGIFYDWGSHYLDWILNLLPGAVQSVSGSEQKRIWHDVSNADQARIGLRLAGGREAEFMHSDIAAAAKPKWYILGTKGAIVADWRSETVKARSWSGDLLESHLAPSEALPTVTVHLRQENGTIDSQRLTLPPPPIFPFHRNLANHILAGEALAVTPVQARRNIAVMEAATTSAREGGRQISVDC